MNKIETLIKELCPDGVEWKLLEEVCDFKRGQSLTSKKAIFGDIPVIAGGQKPAFMHNVSNRENETIVVAGSGANAGFVSYWNQPIFVSDAFSVDIKNSDELNTKYVFHYLLSNQQKIYATKSGAGIPHVYGRNISQFKIPVPPFEVQEEIVKILDKFTDYVTELTTELTLRQKQYHYYRDMLLSFEDDFYQVKWKCLEDLCDVRDGTHDSPIKQNSGKLLITSKNIKNGCVSYKDAYYISQEDFNSINVRSKVDKDDILFTMIGTVGEIAHVTSEPDYAIKNVGLIKTGNKVFARYLFHYLQSSLAKKYIEDNKSKGSQVFLALGKIRKFPIPYIDTKIQSRIVQVLDNFDAVCNDLNIGLPKEIELRQKQYEFFRDKLLTFAAEGVYTDSTVQTRHN